MTTHVIIRSDSLPETYGSATICEEVRQILRRPDLSDDVLLRTIAEHRFSTASELSADDLAAGKGTRAERSRAIRTLMVPPPRHGLDMPQHDLNPPAALRFVPAVSVWRRLVPALKPQLKRVRVPVKGN